MESVSLEKAMCQPLMTIGKGGRVGNCIIQCAQRSVVRICPGAESPHSSGAAQTACNAPQLGNAADPASFFSPPPPELSARERAEIQRQFGHLIQKYGTSMVGESRPMMEFLACLDKAAQTDISVLLQGESGTGKEEATKALHAHSSRAQEAMVTVNMAALPTYGNLFELELFGRVPSFLQRGQPGRKGLFEAADGGTIFLDEIGELPLPQQAALLRVVENGEIQKLGADRPIKVDARLIAATNKNLAEMEAQGLFREDLRYRLNRLVIRVPALRERKSDIPLMVERFLKEFSQKHGFRVPLVSAETMHFLLSFDWPGNVRQLKHVLEAASLSCTGKTIRNSHLPETDGVRKLAEWWQRHAHDQPSGIDCLSKNDRATLAKLEKAAPRADRKKKAWFVDQVCRDAGVSKTHAYRVLSRAGLTPDDLPRVAY